MMEIVMWQYGTTDSSEQAKLVLSVARECKHFDQNCHTVVTKKRDGGAFRDTFRSCALILLLICYPVKDKSL